MKIRQANKFDRDNVVAMLNRYKEFSPLEFHHNADPQQGYKIFDHMIAGAGICFVAEEHDGLIGFLLAVRNPNVWDPKHWAMQEMAYWVNPERRGSTAGHRLLISYKTYCEDLKRQKQIDYYTISKMATSPDLKYEKLGFSLLESTWSQ